MTDQTAANELQGRYQATLYQQHRVVWRNFARIIWALLGIILFIKLNLESSSMTDH